VTAPLITPFVRRVGSRTVIVAGFIAATIGLGAFGFIGPSWKYAAMVGPLIAIAAGLGLANGPASSIATACVPEDQVGAASGISNMGRYVGAAVLTSVAAAVYNTVTTNHRSGGASASASLAYGFSRAAIALAVFCACGIALAALVGRHRTDKAGTIHYAAAAAATSHTVSTSPTNAGSSTPPQDARHATIAENLPIHPKTPPCPAP